MNFKYIVRDEDIFLSYLGIVLRINNYKRYTLQELLNLILLDKEIFFGIDNDKQEQLLIYKINNMIFRINVSEKKSLLTYFPNALLLSKQDENQLFCKYNFLKHIKGTYFSEIISNNKLQYLKQGISSYHVSYKSKELIKLSNQKISDITVFDTLYFKGIIYDYNILCDKEKIIIELYSVDDKTLYFEGDEVEDAIFITIKYLMEDKLGYKNIGIGRTKEEACLDFYRKYDEHSIFKYCQDSLAKHIGVVLTRRI